MNYFRFVFLISFFMLITGCQPTTTIAGYSPRWVDYEEWGKLQIGMDYFSVINLLGEPFMTSEGEIVNGQVTQTYVYKMRAKLYVAKLVSKRMKFSWSEGKEIPVIVEAKPEKFSNTQVWGEVFDVFLVFENNKLVKWKSPELKRISDSMVDSLHTNTLLITK